MASEKAAIEAKNAKLQLLLKSENLFNMKKDMTIKEEKRLEQIML